MTQPHSDHWIVANQRHLSRALAEVRGVLERHVRRRSAADPAAGRTTDGDRPPGAAPTPPAADAPGAEPDLVPPPALEALCRLFDLTPFERGVLLLCAGQELESGFAALAAAAQGDAQRAFPTFSLALAVLPGAHWSALSPARPLRAWRLVEVGAGVSLTASPLRIDERVLHHLTGVWHLDERLAPLLELVDLPAPPSAAAAAEGGDGAGGDAAGPPPPLVPSHAAVVDRVVQGWARAGGGPVPAVQLYGPGPAEKRAVAAAACAAGGFGLAALAADAVPAAAPAELDSLVRLCEREAALGGPAVLVECDDVDPSDAARWSAVGRFVSRARSPVLVSVRDRRAVGRCPCLAFEVAPAAPDEQRAAWAAALGATPVDETEPGTTARAAAERAAADIDALVGQFDLGLAAIRAAAAEARIAADAPAEKGAPAEDAGARAAWAACRAATRGRADALARRVEARARWDDLVLPDPQRRTLGEIVAHVRHRATVYDRWGFGGRGTRGLGISALFAGPSGTGKTLAAEVLAAELAVDLYRVDLAGVVSKYIGETEKNLGRVFDAAEAGGALLLFDEADALFGKRSEVKDSHDRYANIEVSYLLQRMEAYRGLAVLTTNLRQALDPAFLRRIRFAVPFPFPDAAQRREIWRRAFPPDAPTEGLDLAKLARLTVAGGNIHNIAMAAAFLAAAERPPAVPGRPAVRMHHVLQAARTEYAKLEKPLSEAEVAEWV